MINFQLITKISGYDSGFRRQIIDMIARRFSNIEKDLRPMIAEQKWVPVELLLGEYLIEIGPYTQLSVANQLRDLLNRLSAAEADAEKAVLAGQFLSDVGKGIDEAQRAVVSPAADSAYRASA